LGDRLQDLTSGLNTASDKIQLLRAEADTSISIQVEILNTSLMQLEQLNSDIVSATVNGIDPSGLRDQRQMVVDKIAEIVPVRELDRQNGRIALMTPSGEMLIDDRAKVFEFSSNPVIIADMTLASGALNGISVDGAPLAADGVGKLSGGTLGAAFQARDVELVAAQDGLDAIAADLIQRFQDPNVDPSLAIGQAGLLTDNGIAYDSVNLIGLAGRISINSSVDPAQGGAFTNLRDGINAVTPGPSGNATLLQSLSSALSTPLASGSDASLQSAAGRASNFEAHTGHQRLNFEAELSFSNARWSSLKEAEAAGGVDTDYEMQMLLKVEQAFAANARVIQTVNTLMQRLMEI
jgi:flagellar hook-associated protein 1 FlgK